MQIGETTLFTKYYLYMKLKSTAVCILFLLHLVSCRNTHRQDILPVIDIESGVQKQSSVNLSEYCSKIEYIPLQTDSNSLIDNMRLELYAYDGNYCFINFSMKECKVFDRTGKYLRSIGKAGRAGNEFNTIIDMKMNPGNGNIIIYDWDKLVIYDHHSGAYIKQIHLSPLKYTKNLSIEGFNVTGDTLCLHTLNREYDNPGLIFLDMDGTELASHQKENRIKHPTEFEREGMRYRTKTTLGTYVYNDLLRLVDPTTDTIFTFSRHLQKSPCYLVNLGKYKLNPDRSNKHNSIQINPRMIWEAEKILVFTIFTNENKFEGNNPDIKMGYMLYDKITGSTRMLPYDKDLEIHAFNNDLDGGVPIQPQGITGNKLYQSINATQFIAYSKRFNSKKMKEIAAGLTENSNPVVIVATLK